MYTYVYIYIVYSILKSLGDSHGSAEISPITKKL